jgi:hypothetical protein
LYQRDPSIEERYRAIICKRLSSLGIDSTSLRCLAGRYTDKKENPIFLIYREIQSGAVAKSYMRKGFLIYEEMRKYFPIYEEAVSAVSHI